MIGILGSEKVRRHVVPFGLVRLRGESWQDDAMRVNAQVFLEGRALCGPKIIGRHSGRPSIWPKISSKIAMPVFSGMNLIGGLLFGSIGFVAFIYGKRMHVWKPMFLGLALMAYPYFVENDIALFAIGAVGTAALFLFRE